MADDEKEPTSETPVEDPPASAPEAAPAEPSAVPDTDPDPAPLPFGSDSDPLGFKDYAERPKQTSAISSGPFEISRASFVDSLELSDSRVPADLPPSAVIADAMGRKKAGLSLGAIVGISVGVLVVATGLSLLLFR